MIAIVTAVLFVGYTLVYAAVANGGKLAAEPWSALTEDAYTGQAAGKSGAASGGASVVGKAWELGKNLIPFGGFLP